MRVGYSRKMNWFILCVVAVLVSQGNGQNNTTQASTAASTAVSNITTQPTVNVTTPQPTVNITTSQPTGNVTTQPTGNVTTPRPTGNITTPQPTVNVTTPQPTVNVTTPHTTVNVTTPQPTVNVTTPQPTVNVTTPQPTGNVTTPQPTGNVTTTQPTGNVTTLQPTVNVTTPRPTGNITTQPTANVTTPQPSNTTVPAPTTTPPPTTTAPTTTVPPTTTATPPTTTRVTATNTIVPTKSASTTILPTPIIPTTTTAYVENTTYHEYNMAMKITKIDTETADGKEKQTLAIISSLINECSDEYTEKGRIYYVTFQKYLKKQICGIRAFNKECELTITNLTCGLKIECKLVLGVQGSDPSGISTGHSGDVIKDEIKDGSLGAFAVDTTSFKLTFKGITTKPKATEEPPQAKFDVYVIVTMEYTWYEFCKVKEDFRKTIAERSHELNGRQLNATDIFIVNGERNCANPNKTKEGIDVWFVALGSDADKVTVQIGDDLKDLFDSRQLGKLGSQFETKILKVAFGGKNAPQSPSSSNNMKIWLAVGITLAILLLFILVLWKCYPRGRRVRPDHFTMDNVDDEGFDGQEGAHILLSQKASTLKDAPEQEKPLKKTENENVSLVLKKESKDSNKQGPSHQEEGGKKASLGEDNDDR